MTNDFLAVWRGERPRRPVWTADLTYWMAGETHAGRARPEWASEEGLIEFHLRLGVMPYFCYGYGIWGEDSFGGGVSRSSETVGDRTVCLLRTPWGELREESVFCRDSVSQAIVAHFVETETQLDILLRALERRTVRPRGFDGLADRVRRWTGRGGYPILCLPRSPFSCFAYEWAGIQNATYLVADHEEKVRLLLALLEEQEKPMLDAVCAVAPPLVHFPDNLTSDTLTGYYEAFMEGPHRRRLARLHAAGVKAVVHLDGTVRGLLPKLAVSGFDGVEALTPSPVGDMTAAEMRAVAGRDDLVLWGGVPGAMFAKPHMWSDMERHVQSVLEAWRGTPFILGVGDQVPPDGDIEYCRRIAALCAGA